MTFPPICGPGGGGWPQPGPTPAATFPPACGAPAPQAQVGAAGAGFTVTGTAVEPRCFFQTQVGSTCPPRRCEIPTFDRIRCTSDAACNIRTIAGTTCPKAACDIWPNRQVGVAPTNPAICDPATFPPVCGAPAPQAQAYTVYPQHTCGFICNTQVCQAAPPPPPQAQPYTVYPQYTCGFVCNTQFCQAAPPQPQVPMYTVYPHYTCGFVCNTQVCQAAPPPPPQAQPYTVYPQYTCGFVCNTQYPPCGGHQQVQQLQQQQQQQAQVGAIFTGTLVSPRCLRTIDIVVCQPTTRGDTCPPTICTIAGVGCPMRPMQAQPQVGFGAPAPQPGAGGVTVIGRTCPFFLCQPTFNMCPPPR